MASGTSDLTCLSVFNAITAAMTAGRFDPFRPFDEFIQEYQVEIHRTKGLPTGTEGVPQGRAGES